MIDRWDHPTCLRCKSPRCPRLSSSAVDCTGALRDPVEETLRQADQLRGLSSRTVLAWVFLGLVVGLAVLVSVL